MFDLLLVAGCVALVLYGLALYNGLVTLKNNVAKSWSDIDVILKQRFDELPKLIAVCEQYMSHERGTLERVTQARSQISHGGTVGGEFNPHAQNALSDALKSLFAVVENYPNLKADRNFTMLQARISELENIIADRREFFNASVNLYNIGIEKMPDALLAGWLSYQPKRLWQIDPTHREDVKVEFTQR